MHIIQIIIKQQLSYFLELICINPNTPKINNKTPIPNNDKNGENNYNENDENDKENNNGKKEKNFNEDNNENKDNINNEENNGHDKKNNYKLLFKTKKWINNDSKKKIKRNLLNKFSGRKEILKKNKSCSKYNK